jgi:hypothetical protein
MHYLGGGVGHSVHHETDMHASRREDQVEESNEDEPVVEMDSASGDAASEPLGQEDDSGEVDEEEDESSLSRSSSKDNEESEDEAMNDDGYDST